MHMWHTITHKNILNNGYKHQKAHTHIHTHIHTPIHKRARTRAHTHLLCVLHLLLYSNVFLLCLIILFTNAYTFNYMSPLHAHNTTWMILHSFEYLDSSTIIIINGYSFPVYTHTHRHMYTTAICVYMKVHTHTHIHTKHRDHFNWMFIFNNPSITLHLQ